MSDPNIPQSWLLGIISALVLGIGTYFRHKVEVVDDRVNKLRETFVTRAELAALEQRIEARTAVAETRGIAQHKENTDNFREIRLQLESSNTKLFEIAKK